MFNRIRIVGGPGSGKTYLATKLTQALNIPSFKLDELYYAVDAKERDQIGNPITRDKELQKILRKKKWVIEGHWDDWSRPSFDKAEQVVLLNPSSRTIRIFQRHIKRRLGIIKGRKESFKDLKYLLSWSKKYAQTLQQIIKYLSKSNIPHKVFSSADDAYAWLKK